MKKISLRQLDLTGKKFGSRIVLRAACNSEITVKTQGRHWVVKCDCGREDIVTTGHLRYRPDSKCKQCCMINHRKESGECSFNALYLLHKHRKAAKDLGFNLTKKHFRKLTSSNCYYCNSPPTSKI